LGRTRLSVRFGAVPENVADGVVPEVTVPIVIAVAAPATPDSPLGRTRFKMGFSAVPVMVALAAVP
jgi:hypothetical protein